MADLFAAIVCAVLLDISLCRNVNAQSMVNPVLVHPTINQGINTSGNGFEFSCSPGCATAASPEATCNTTITWNTPFADTNYSAVCQGAVSNTGIPVLSLTSGGTVSSIVITTVALTATAASFGQVCCLGIHS